MVCAVNGSPSSSTILSALPWSAVMSSTPPISSMDAATLPTQVSTALNGSLCSLEHAGVADHVAVCKVQNDHIVLAGLDGLNHLIRDFVSAHFRLEVIRCNLRGLDKDAVLTPDTASQRRR